jgi:hypothetical protein
MTAFRRGVSLLGFTLAAALLSARCTGGTESSAAEEKMPSKEAPAATQEQPDATAVLTGISPAIPVYQGAQYRDDLTRRDEVMIRNRYGAAAKVYTLATDDSFPQVYHYYTTYLAQFRAFPARDTFPPDQQNWRTLEVQLNQAMQDPFIPGESLPPHSSQVTLQVAETEAEPRTVIRYIVTPDAGATAPIATPIATTSSPTTTAAP